MFTFKLLDHDEKELAVVVQPRIEDAVTMMTKYLLDRTFNGESIGAIHGNFLQALGSGLVPIKQGDVVEFKVSSATLMLGFKVVYHNPSDEPEATNDVVVIDAKAHAGT